MSTEWRQRPIDEWPGELTKHRTRAPFTAKWHQTQTLLDRELGFLNARSVVMLVALDAKDFRIDGQPRANARANHPGVILSFESKFGPLRYACDTFDDFSDNIRAIALGLEALRKVERYGITKRGEQYKGWSALPPGTVMGLPMSREEAWRVLCDLAERPEELAEARWSNADDVKRLYAWAVKLHHPDHGGDPDLFRRATEARDRLIGAA